jgi:hypothetical protein
VKKTKSDSRKGSLFLLKMANYTFPFMYKTTVDGCGKNEENMKKYFFDPKDRVENSKQKSILFREMT